MKPLLPAASLLASLLFAAGVAAQPKPVTLNVVTSFPHVPSKPGDPLSSYAQAFDWMKSVEERSQGRIKFNYRRAGGDPDLRAVFCLPARRSRRLLPAHHLPRQRGAGRGGDQRGRGDAQGDP